MLRDYQQQAVDRLWEYWGKGNTKPCILQLSTGAGKSWVIAEIVRRLNAPVLVLQPSKEILEQNYEKLSLAGVPQQDVYVCSASANSWMIGKITLATIGTIGKHAHLCQNFGAIVVDECDVVNNDVADGQYLRFFNQLPNVPIVGLTATPWRNQSFRDKNGQPAVYCRPLTRIYTRGGKQTERGVWFWTGGIIYKCEIPFLQEQGFLAPTEYYQTQTDWSFLHNYPGRVDYDQEEMTQWISFDGNMSRFHQAIAWCMKYNLKTIVFAPNIHVNFQLAECILSAGGTVQCMDSTNDSRQSRQAKMDGFRAGAFQFLVNVGMVGRGVDVPSVDCVLLCRPTKSLSLYMQYVGRCLRPDPNNPDKIARVVDLAGNVARFGKVEDVALGKQKRANSYGGNFEVDIVTLKINNKQYKWEKVG